MFGFNDKEITEALSFIKSHINDDNSQYIESITNCISNNAVYDLTKEQKNIAREFYLEHKYCCRNILGKDAYSTTGGGFSYIVTWTPIGFIYKYRCNVCRECADLTDYSQLEKNHTDYKQFINIQPFSFVFCGTGLGMCISVIDNYTHDSVDITDTSCW